MSIRITGNPLVIDSTEESITFQCIGSEDTCLQVTGNSDGFRIEIPAFEIDETIPILTINGEDPYDFPPEMDGNGEFFIIEYEN